MEKEKSICIHSGELQAAGDLKQLLQRWLLNSAFFISLGCETLRYMILLIGIFERFVKLARKG